MAAMTRNRLWAQLLIYPGHTLPTAAAPVLVAAGLAWRDGVFAPLPLALFLLSSWLVHLAGVLFDNHELLRRHPGLPEHPELVEAVADRTLALSTIRSAIVLCMVLALATGAWLLWLGGPPFVWVGALGVVASLGYHGWPLSYAKWGLAEPIFFLMFGVVAVAAPYQLQALQVLPQAPAPPWTAWLVGLPVGALITNVLIIDDMRDRHWDARKGWRTVAVRWGLRGSRTEFVALMALAYLAPPLLWWLGFGPGALLPMLTLPLAMQASRAILALDDAKALLPWTPRVARLALLYAALQAVGLAWPLG